MHVKTVWVWIGLAAASVPGRQMIAAPRVDRVEMGVDAHAERRDPINPKLVSLAMTNVPLKTVLSAISRQAEVQIIFSGRVVPLDRPVSVTVKNVSAVEAVRRALAGIDVAVNVLDNGNIALLHDGAHSRVAQGGTGVVTGFVRDSATRHRISQARVSVEGTKLSTLTELDGRFVLPNVPAGTRKISVRLLGYIVRTQSVAIRSGDTASADFLLASTVVRLSEVVTTGAGDRKRVEVGNSIGTINADSVVRTTAIRNISDLLNGRVSGTNVLTSGGTVGAGSKIRIRGLSSLLGNEDPVVIVDGVRYNAAYTRPLTGSVTTGSALPANSAASSYGVPVTARLDDIDPESVESVEVLKGPAASALYGSDAASGVIIIKTKRGQAGPARWAVTAEGGRSTMNATFADNYFGWGKSFGGVPSPNTCTLDLITARLCTQDSVTHFNPLNHAATSPFKTGTSARYNGQVSGGTQQMQYFVNASYNDDVGMLGLPPAIKAATIKALKGSALPDYADKPNVLNSVSVSSMLTAQFSAADLALSTNGSRTYHRDVPQGATGFMTYAQQAPGYIDTLSNGWGTSTPATNFLTRNDDQTNHGYGSLSGNWRPAGQLTVHATGGIDLSTLDAQSLLMQNYILPGTDGSTLSGHSRSQSTTFVKTLDANGTWTLPIGSRIQLVSTGGANVNGSHVSTVSNRGTGLPLGATTYNSATTIATMVEYEAEQATAGWYVQEALSLNQRFFLNAAIRGDASSAFGSGATQVSYPKWNASWLVSQEPFFPQVPGLSSFRMRVGYGHAGSQPPFDARFETYGFTQGYANGAVLNTVGINSVGNSKLLPERSVETEGGFDVGLGNDRVTFGLTLESKRTQNALVRNPLPPSMGGSLAQYQNIGEIENHSLEIEATAHPIDLSAISWSTTFSLTRGSNKLLKLGTVPAPTFQSSVAAVTVQSRYVEGYPLDGLWTPALLGFNDVNNNGRVDYDELKLSDSLVYVGRSAPAHTVGWQNNVSLWSGRLSVGANFTYEGGATQENGTLRSQCLAARCRGAVDPDASIAEQILARASNATLWPYLEKVSVFRFNELSFNVKVPQSIARSLRVPNASVALLGRNLGLWTHYRGVDPSVNSNVFGGDRVQDSGSIPQPRQWYLRVRLGY